MIVTISGISCNNKRKVIFSESTKVLTLIKNGDNWKEINAGYTHTCGIKMDGSLWCWGNNITGQIGDGTIKSRSSPVRVGKSVGWVSVALGDYHTCGIRSDNSLWCWGGHKYGVVNSHHKSTNKFPKLVVFKNQRNLNFKEIGLGDGHTCGLTTKGRIYCWGGDVRRVGGGGKKVDTSLFPTPVDISVVKPSRLFKTLTIGSGHTCAITIDGRAYCWGRNDRGQVGNADYKEWVLSPSPVNTSKITGTKTFEKIAAGTYHTCGIMTDGAVYCWGANDKGQVGNGNNEDQRIPVGIETAQIKGDKKMAVITGGFAYSCGITKDNIAYCWGEYTPAMCEGNRNAKGCLSPTQVNTSKVSGTKLFKSVSAGCAHACAVTIESRGYCWGNNEDGRLGIGFESN